MKRTKVLVATTIMAVTLIAGIVLDYGRSSQLYVQFMVSSEALLYASMIQSHEEWIHSNYYYKREWLSPNNLNESLFLVDNLEDFISRSFPANPDGSGWGGFVVYPEKFLARFNFPITSKNIFSEKLHWGHLNILAYNLFLLPTKSYFPLSNWVAICGMPVIVNSYEELETIIRDPETYAKGKKQSSKFITRSSKEKSIIPNESTINVPSLSGQ
ncbi:MAG: hypothetical protein H3C47_15880 [Candidatus Cloacimonetes bacterium]|nr:hypothetical protein [Candidatus Cloacimonadota bacterium]